MELTTFQCTGQRSNLLNHTSQGNFILFSTLSLYHQDFLDCVNSSGNRKYLHSFLILIEYCKCFTINFEMCSKISLDAPKETFVLSDRL